MSESKGETKGRCRREMAAAFKGTGFTANKEDWILAHGIDRLAAELDDVKEMVREIALQAPSEFGRDAIDRIAADVAAIKAKVDSVEPEDVEHFVEAEKAWLALVEEKRDAAIRERDEARKQVESMTARFMEARKAFRAEAERRTTLKAELAAAQAETQRIQDEAYDREETERVKRLKAEIEKTHRALLNRTCERDAARADVERLKAELAARPAAAGWLTDGERRILAAHARSLREQQVALERGGLSIGYSTNPGALKHDADTIDAILARAGSPPVVEVPEMVFGSGSYEMQKRYRAAIDKAGIAWKEAPRE